MIKRALFLIAVAFSIGMQPLCGVNYHVVQNKPQSAIVKKTSSLTRRVFYSAQSLVALTVVLSAGYNLLQRNKRAEAYGQYTQEQYAAMLAGVVFGIVGIEAAHSKLCSTYEDDDKNSFTLIPKTFGDRVECGLWGLGTLALGGLLIAATKYCNPAMSYSLVKDALTGHYVQGIPRNFMLSKNLFRLSSALLMGSHGVEWGIAGLQKIAQAFRSLKNKRSVRIKSVNHHD